MKKQLKWDVPRGTLLLTISFLSGAFLGFLFAKLISTEGQGTLTDFFQSYFLSLEEGTLQADFYTSLWSNLKPPLYAFLLGFSLLGTIGIPLLFTTQGFLFTFSISTLCRLLGTTGLVPAFFLFCLPALLWIPTLFFIGLQGYRTSLQLWHHSKLLDIYTPNYFLKNAIGFLAVFASIYLDYYMMPLIIQGILPFISI